MKNLKAKVILFQNFFIISQELSKIQCEIKTHILKRGEFNALIGLVEMVQNVRLQLLFSEKLNNKSKFFIDIATKCFYCDGTFQNTTSNKGYMLYVHTHYFYTIFSNPGKYEVKLVTKK